MNQECGAANHTELCQSLAMPGGAAWKCTAEKGGREVQEALQGSKCSGKTEVAKGYSGTQAQVKRRTKTAGWRRLQGSAGRSA